MRYQAELYSSLTNKRFCKVIFDCADPLLVNQYAKSRGSQKGLRNVQFLNVRNVIELRQKPD